MTRSRVFPMMGTTSSFDRLAINTIMIKSVTSKLKAFVNYLGDAHHRRFIAAGVAIIASHALGKAFDVDTVSVGLDILIGGLAGSWSPKSSDQS
jgi:hypothetical protein